MLFFGFKEIVKAPKPRIVGLASPIRAIRRKLFTGCTMEYWGSQPLGGTAPQEKAPIGCIAVNQTRPYAGQREMCSMELSE